MSQQVRETETWVPAGRDGLESSGDSNGSDFGFTDDEDDDEPELYEYDDEELSGSGDGGQSLPNVFFLKMRSFYCVILRD